MYKYTLLLPVLVLAALAEPGFGANVSRHGETASGLLGWRIDDENVQIQLNPLLKDQVRAFYLGRGFSELISNRIANACVYQTVITNVSAMNVPFDVDLDKWRIEDALGSSALRSKQSWIDEWTELGADNSAILAFRWASFPTEQHYAQLGDYGWGMLLFGNPDGEPFDLRVKWTIDGQVVEQRVEGLSCEN